MRIQSIQNQQTQNRPTFSANLRVGQLPDLLGGVRIVRFGSEFTEDSIEVAGVLKHLLSDRFKGFEVISGPRVSADGANLRHFESESGDKVLLNKGPEQDGGKPIGIIFKPADGGEIVLGRDDIYHVIKPPSKTDEDFDKAAAILDAKAKS